MHAHFQIEYVVSDGTSRESLQGFDPRNEEDRKLVHDCLDEYLDEYLIPKMNRHDTRADDCGFRVFSDIDERK